MLGFMNTGTTEIAKPVVCIIDSDAAVRDSLRSLFAELDVCVRLYPRAEDFLREPPPAGPACLITELYLPGISGLELLGELRARALQIPTIVLTSASDVATAVRAMRAGAVDFIDKPIVHPLLLNRVRQLLSTRT
jgi:FixJ family two-component response regulator